MPGGMTVIFYNNCASRAREFLEGSYSPEHVEEPMSRAVARSLRLLWVENHPTFPRLAGRQFLSEHAVTVVACLAEARRALAEQPFDAILLDYDLDDGKGTALLPFIEQLPCRPVVIATSAHEAGNEALVRAGADAVCGKLRFAEIGAVLVGAVTARGRSRPG
jgi:CheY-like chemotaxis protein